VVAVWLEVRVEIETKTKGQRRQLEVRPDAKGHRLRLEVADGWLRLEVWPGTKVIAILEAMRVILGEKNFCWLVGCCRVDTEK
jgi:hypothetical protein